MRRTRVEDDALGRVWIRHDEEYVAPVTVRLKHESDDDDRNRRDRSLMLRTNWRATTRGRFCRLLVRKTGVLDCGRTSRAYGSLPRSSHECRLTP